MALVVLVVTISMAVGTGRGQPRSSDVLRVRGLIIEDRDGRERILLGAPVPKVTGRKRADDVTGLVVLGDKGADRVQIGNVGGPQIRGVLKQRKSGSVGITVNDPNGDERGGFGVLDNGRVVLGLDYAEREAVSLFVMPDEGFAGLKVAGEHGAGFERIGLVVNNKTGKALMKLADTNDSERMMVEVEGQTPARLLVIDPTTGRRDVLEKLRP